VTSDSGGRGRLDRVGLRIAVFNGVVCGAVIGVAVRLVPDGIRPVSEEITSLTTSWHIAGAVGLLTGLIVGVASYLHLRYVETHEPDYDDD
jgi:hypothetical protein